MIEQLSCSSKELLVAVLYGEASPEERATFEAHLGRCDSCRDEFEALGGVRRALQEWDAPQLRTNFRIVADEVEEGDRAATSDRGRVLTGPSRWWTPRQVGWAGLAAAAAVVMGISAGLANLDVTVGPDGLRIRTGWHKAPESVASTSPAASPSASPAATPASFATHTAPDAAQWRAELAALEQRLRSELARPAATASPVAPVSASRAEEEAILRRVQALIDQAETRQQQNLALRVTEIAREFDMQRKADIVQIQQGLGKIEGRAEAEAARTQQMMNYLVRTASSTTPR